VSQKDLARAMTERGWKWSQSTVWSVETGERPLRLAEAEDLATILSSDVRQLGTDTGVANMMEKLRQVSSARSDLEKAILDYGNRQAELAHMADSMDFIDPESSAAYRAMVEEKLSPSPEDVVNEIRVSWQKFRAATGESSGSPVVDLNGTEINLSDGPLVSKHDEWWLAGGSGRVGGSVSDEAN
jgi:hypothetical protein